MESYLRSFLIAFAFLGLVSSQAHAALILSPVAATGTTGTINSFNRMVNQSGLSSTFNSGVDDFDAYMLGAPSHNTNFSTEFFTANGSPLGSITFDLGSVFTVDGFALWNHSAIASRSLANFELLAAVTETGPYINLGSFTAAPGAPSGAQIAQVFNFSATNAQYIRLDIISNGGDASFTTISEVAFSGDEVAPVSSPSTFLLVLGSLGLIFNMRRKSWNQGSTI